MTSRPLLLATDLDGTLLGADGTVSDRTRAALRAAADAGVATVFVTARPPRWLAPLADAVGADGTAVCANGAAVVDVRTLTVLEEHPIDADSVRALLVRLRAALGPAARFAAESREGIAHETGFAGRLPLPAGCPAAERLEDVLGPGTLKLLVRTGEPWAVQRPDDFAATVADAVGELGTASSSGAVGLGEIGPAGVSKASTLASWAAGRGIGPDRVWAVGDAPNDLPMLRWAGRALAVANAHAQVLAAADEVLPANTDDGVAHLLEPLAAG